MEHTIEIQKPVEIHSKRSPRGKHRKVRKGKYNKSIYSPRKLNLEILSVNENTIENVIPVIPVTDIKDDVNIIIPNIDSTNTDSTNTDSTNTDSDNPESDNTDRSHISTSSDELYQEYQENINVNKPYIFTDIIDDKHLKYMDYYNGSKGFKEPLTPTLFWGLGIENESYLMVKKKLNTVANLKCKRERYSVDYFKSFKPDQLKKVIDTITTQNTMKYPIYINAHTLQATDKHNEHRTIYDEHSTPNKKFTEAIHDVLIRENAYYKSVYYSSVVFDGDSIEFITQEFYNTTVDTCVKELCSTKQTFLKEISPYFTQWGEITFPDYNYGIVTFLTTYRRNLGLCNNGTLHINFTLPTLLENGIIVNKHKFAEDHLRFIRCIQIVEPLLVACYGTPDVFSVIDKNSGNYSIGSLRVSLSRYISLQTYDTEQPVNGKLLLMPKPEDKNFWYNMYENSPYFQNKEIGYDINFNKFKNHGVEIRFFDWFPEEYLKDVMNFIVLLAEHSTSLTRIFDKSGYNVIICKCIQQGFTCVLTKEECNIILNDLDLMNVYNDMSPYALLCYINIILYEMHSQGEIVGKMSPNIKLPILVNYNKEAYQALHHDINKSYE